MSHRTRLVIATSVLIFATGIGLAAAQTPATSGGAVDPALIEDLVAANRILAEEGVLDAYGHVSIRHPSDPNRYLMSRSLAPVLVTASDIMEYDLDSNPIDPRGRRSVIERFIHGEIYKLRPDVKAVIHSHSPAVIPFGVTQAPMRPVIHAASFFMGRCSRVGQPRRAGSRQRGNAGAKQRSRQIHRVDPRRQASGADARAWQCGGRAGRANGCTLRDLHRGECPIAGGRNRHWRSHQLHLCGRRCGQR